MPDRVSHDLLSFPPLNTELIGREVVIFDQIPSTNEHALTRGGDGTVFVADSQTAGRGRHGRLWHSAPGVGLWFSIAFEGAIEGLLFAAALAVREALRPFGEATFKWPNDLLLNGKKVCGILIENRQGHTALGIGINVRHQRADFPEELVDHATSIEMATGRTVDRCKLLADVLRQIDDRVKLLKVGGLEELRQEWMDACGLMGRRVRCENAEGTVIDIDNSGALIVSTATGRQRLVSGEIDVVSGA